ncbi:MAG: potassium transporter TrkA [Desulfurococcaceae archaeon]
MSRLSPEIHRRFHLKPSMVQYRPEPIKNILENIWNYTNVAIDLAFYAYFTREQELALKILDLDKKISEYIGQFVMHNAMAFGRSRKSGYAGLLAFYYSTAVDGISDSVKDIVYTLLVGYPAKVSYSQILQYAEGEVIGKIKASRDFKVIELTDVYPVDIVLVVEKEEYVFAPKPERLVKKDSDIYVRGFREPVLRLLQDHGVECGFDKIDTPGLEQVVKQLVDIKDCTVLMLDLAHYVLMEHSKELMEEVEDLEIQIDWMHMETISLLRDLAVRIDPDTFIGLITLLKELEDIADASEAISKIPSLQEEFPGEYRELFSKVFESIGERVKTITTNRSIDLHTIEHFLRKYGGRVLAVKTKDSWIAYPFAKDISLKQGDRLIVVFPAEFSEEVDKLIAAKVT